MPPRQGERDVMYQTIDEIHDLRSVKAIRRMQDTASMSRKAKPLGYTRKQGPVLVKDYITVLQHQICAGYQNGNLILGTTHIVLEGEFVLGSFWN